MWTIFCHFQTPYGKNRGADGRSCTRRSILEPPPFGVRRPVYPERFLRGAAAFSPARQTVLAEPQRRHHLPISFIPVPAVACPQLAGNRQEDSSLSTFNRFSASPLVTRHLGQNDSEVSP